MATNNPYGYQSAASTKPMVPATYEPLAVLPLTPSGKLDRRALAAGPTPLPERSAPLVAPATELERRIAAVWSAVLGPGRLRADVGHHLRAPA